MFFNNTEALNTVSVASVNIRPTTGIKLPVTNFAARIVTPSATAVVAPCTEITPKKTAKKTPRVPIATFRNKLESWVNNSNQAVGNTALSTGVWHHVVMVGDEVDRWFY